MPAWRREGVAEVDARLTPEHARVVHAGLDHRMAQFAGLGTAFYDMAHHEHPLPPERRQAVARGVVMLLGTLELCDNVIDEPGSAATSDDRAQFMDRTRGALLTKTTPRIVPSLPLPDVQLATYALARGTNDFLDLTRNYWTGAGLNSAVWRMELEILLQRLRHPILQQLEEHNPGRLLDLAQQIGSTCSVMSVLPGEILDNEHHSDVRKIANSFGKFIGILDHGSEVLDDLRDGTNTYATALIATHGLNAKTLQRIRYLRRSAGEAAFNEGLHFTKSREQAQIYRAIGRILRVGYALKRRKLNTLLATGRLSEVAPKS